MKKGQGLPFEVLVKLLEIIYFSIFTVWQFQFIFFLAINLINTAVGLFKFALGLTGIIELTVLQNGRISEVYSIQYQKSFLDFKRL